MVRILLHFLAACALLLPSSLGAQRLSVADEHIPGQVIVHLRAERSAAAFVRLMASLYPDAPLQHLRTLGTRHNTHLFGFDPSAQAAETLLRRLRREREVVAAQLNYVVRSRNTPNDPDFAEQWPLERVGAPAVWAQVTDGVTFGGDTIVMAILDSGFQDEHEDLVDNVWTNHYEVPGDGIDNDNNGFIDDYKGWNFRTNSPIHTPEQHGMGVAGLAGARGNNGKGITGMNWNAKLMLLDVRTVDEIVAAYDYVIEQRHRYNQSNGAAGAFVVVTNASFGQNMRFCADQPVWGSRYDLLGAVGVLTGAGTANNNWNVDEVGDMPTTCPSDYIVTVCNTDEDDKLHVGSAFGPASIDLGAPGQNSRSLRLDNGYGPFGGNSAAAPHLSGAIALLYSIPCANIGLNAIDRPAETALLMREVLLASVDTLPSLLGKTVTGGRLNVAKSFELLKESCEASTAPLAIMNAWPNPAQVGGPQVYFAYETPDFSPCRIQVHNALGQLVLQDQAVPDRLAAKVYELEVAHWASGLYVFTLMQGTARVSTRFVLLD